MKHNLNINENMSMYNFLNTQFVLLPFQMCANMTRL
jgi:hypothetical protein